MRTGCALFVEMRKERLILFLICVPLPPRLDKINSLVIVVASLSLQSVRVCVWPSHMIIQGVVVVVVKYMYLAFRSLRQAQNRQETRFDAIKGMYHP